MESVGNEFGSVEALWSQFENVMAKDSEGEVGSQEGEEEEEEEEEGEEGNEGNEDEGGDTTMRQEREA
ncbi:MAG: hypothetical protein M1812_001962 [Candelaria pacifica]|nr:MAG: hypothetical protein M1812_001962 [Candelaria pacifica]